MRPRSPRKCYFKVINILLLCLAARPSQLRFLSLLFTVSSRRCHLNFLVAGIGSHVHGLITPVIIITACLTACAGCLEIVPFLSSPAPLVGWRSSGREGPAGGSQFGNASKQPRGRSINSPAPGIPLSDAPCVLVSPAGHTSSSSFSSAPPPSPASRQTASSAEWMSWRDCSDPPSDSGTKRPASPGKSWGARRPMAGVSVICELQGTRSTYVFRLRTPVKIVRCEMRHALHRASLWFDMGDVAFGEENQRRRLWENEFLLRELLAAEESCYATAAHGGQRSRDDSGLAGRRVDRHLCRGLIRSPDHNDGEESSR